VSVLEGRRILVTGGASGIGAAAVEAFSSHGAVVAATYNETAAPAELQAAATWWQCDVRSRDQVHGTVAEVAKEFGGLDVLLHAAGTWQPGAPDQISEDDLDFLLATNFKATVFTNQAAFEVMRNSGGRSSTSAPRKASLEIPSPPPTPLPRRRSRRGLAARQRPGDATGCR
jgi:NAD(P)-dependent dehydrogenase (short-subunit alcohol dehydrogenase family)